MKRLSWLVWILILLLALVFIFSSCTCGGSGGDDNDTDDDDTNDDTNDDTDDDDTDDDDDAEGWYIYTIDSENYFEFTSIAVDSSNKVHISYGYSTLYYATNETGFWQISAVDSCGPLDSAIQVDSSNKIYISYRSMRAIKYATNKSGLWQIFTVAQGSSESGPSGDHDFALDSSDKVHVAYYYCRHYEPGGCSGDELRYATNKSGTWQVFTIGEVGARPSIAIDKNDKIHIAYCGDRGLTYATNQMGSWQKDTIVEYFCASSLSLALDSNGKVHISYQDWDSLKYATNASGSWQTLILDASGENVGAYNSLAIDSEGKVHISYLFVGDDVDGASWALKYATNRAGNWETFVIDSKEWTGSYTSIAIDSDDYVHISYKGHGGALKYATNRPPD